jgi:hypothetical protein
MTVSWTAGFGLYALDPSKAAMSGRPIVLADFTPISRGGLRRGRKQAQSDAHADPCLLPNSSFGAASAVSPPALRRSQTAQTRCATMRPSHEASSLDL